jgi:VanZ family protein
LKAFIHRYRLTWFWGYFSLLTYELLLKNPWVILGEKIASDPPLDTSSVPASALLHTSSFSVLGFLFCYAFNHQTAAKKVRYSLWLVAYCGVTEILQFCVPNRWPSGEDILFNVVGLIAGTFIFYQPWRLPAESQDEIQLGVTP